VVKEFHPSTSCEFNIFGALHDTTHSEVKWQSDRQMGPRDDLLRNLLNIFKVFEANVIVLGHMLIKTENSVAGVCNHCEQFVINVNSLLSLYTGCNQCKEFIISVQLFLNTARRRGQLITKCIRVEVRTDMERFRRTCSLITACPQSMQSKPFTRLQNFPHSATGYSGTCERSVSSVTSDFSCSSRQAALKL
jgi:hypothetical protein